MKRLLGTALAILLIIGANFIWGGCAREAGGRGMEIPKPDNAVLDAFDPSLTGSSNELGWKILRELMEDEENLFISPASIYTALAMTYNGARGETREAMQKVLGLEGVELEMLNRSSLARLYLLQEADPAVKLNIANSLWMREGIDFDPDFVDRVEEYYYASSRELDFDSPKAADIINRWVSDRTNRLIEDIVEPPIDPLTILFIINAVYFQGDWAEPFNPDDTREGAFFSPAGEITGVPFMHRSGEFCYLEDEGFQAVRLPYGEEDNLAMYVFLPAAGSSLPAFMEELDQESWREWHRSFQQAEGSLLLPRFTMEYEKTLNDALQSLGMEIAFVEGRADFMDMVNWKGKPGLFISEVKHKSFIQVDEAGTEAAAVTSVEIRLESAPVYSFVMNVDRPFFFLIFEEETETVLFTGTVADPSQ